MKKLLLKYSKHDFEKLNLVSIKNPKGKGYFDELKCKRCGITGKSFELGTIEIDGRISEKRISNCGARAKVRPEKVRITDFTGSSSQFKNLVRGSIHKVIKCPNSEKAKFENDIWVMGVSEPVRLLPGEYEVV